MDNTEKIQELEDRVKTLRYKLMLKGTELDALKQHIEPSKLQRIEKLSKELIEIREEFKNLIQELRDLQYSYYVAYKVSFFNIWNHQIEQEIYQETLFFNIDLNIDLPIIDDWQLTDSNVNKLLLEILFYLKNKYQEITLLKVKRIRI